MKKILLTASMALVAFAGFSQNKSHKVEVVIPTVMDIQMNEGDMTFTYTEGNIRQGENPNTQTKDVKVRSNQAWSVSVYAESDFEPSDNNNTALSIGILSLQNGAAAAIPVPKRSQQMLLGEPVNDLNGAPVYDTNAEEIAKGSKGGFGVNTSTITYAIDLGQDPNIGTDFFVADPDTYSTTLVYTVSAQ